MNIVKDTITADMIDILKSIIGKRLISYDINPWADIKDESLYSVILNCDSERIELFADVDYYEILSGDEYAFFEIHKTSDTGFDKYKVSDNLKAILVNQKIEDIRILTDYYHCTNKDENLDDLFVQDYAIVIVIENKQICFEHLSMFMEFIYITEHDKSKEISFYDNSDNFNGEPVKEGGKFLYHTERSREYKSVMDIHR